LTPESKIPEPRICVSVCAPNAADLAGRLIAAAPAADVIEIRFDCLDTIGRELLRAAIADLRRVFRGKILATYRPADGGQGGARELSNDERAGFWRIAGELADWCDLEFDLELGNEGPAIRSSFERVLVSFHEFERPAGAIDLGPIVEKLAPLGDVLKIAVRADDVSDSIAVWRLLGLAAAMRKEIIPIAMGEAGKWTRILGPAHGAFLTYASTETGNETAPGQIDARELREVYRVDRLDRRTEVYGVVAGNTSYSMSPYLHNAAFASHGLNAVFVPFQVRDVDRFFADLVKPSTRQIDIGIKGFAVTNPHKQAVAAHLDRLDESARRVGAVNTVAIVEGTLVGFNTDAAGFIAPLRTRFGDLKGATAAIFGAGGAARACAYSLTNAGADVTVFARDRSRAEALAREFGCRAGNDAGDFDIVVNATPLGTAGESESVSAVPTEFLRNAKLAYDLVYNPRETLFLSEARSLGIATLDGLEMLVAQAAEQQRIWTGHEPPVEAMKGAALRRLERK